MTRPERLQGPVYDFGKSGHAFSEVVKGVEDAMKQLHGPKYEVDSGKIWGYLKLTIDYVLWHTFQLSDSFICGGSI